MRRKMIMNKKIFELQKMFQDNVGNDVSSQEFRNQMFYALIAEVVEAGNETPWKPWKNKQEFNSEKFLEELADVQLFLVNLVLSSGKSYDEFTKIIENKIEKNFKRQKNDY